MPEDIPKEKQKLPQVFSPEQRGVVQKWITDHWATTICPMCHTGHLEIGNYIVHPETLTISRQSTAPIGYFFIPLNCDNCFYTVFLNAVALGLWQRYTPDAE